MLRFLTSHSSEDKVAQCICKLPWVFVWMKNPLAQMFILQSRFHLAVILRASLAAVEQQSIEFYATLLKSRDAERERLHNLAL